VVTRKLTIARTLSGQLFDALLAGNAIDAEEIVREAIDGGLDQAMIDAAIIAPAMHHVGDAWARGEISVADEHLATQTTYRMLALLREAFRVQRRRPGQRVMLAALEGEEHVLALRMASDLLEQAGFDVRYLGPNVPLCTLPAIVERHAPAVFALTATRPCARRLEASIAAIRRASPSIGLVLGGAGIPRDTLATDWLVVERSVAGVVETVDALVLRPSLN